MRGTTLLEAPGRTKRGVRSVVVDPEGIEIERFGEAA
jgi:hypothetical protein